MALLLKMQDTEKGGEKIVNVDNAVSAEHARIDFDAQTGRELSVYWVHNNSSRCRTILRIWRGWEQA
jgi:hypothetical protein